MGQNLCWGLHLYYRARGRKIVHKIIAQELLPTAAFGAAVSWRESTILTFDPFTELLFHKLEPPWPETECHTTKCDHQCSWPNWDHVISGHVLSSTWWREVHLSTCDFRFQICLSWVFVFLGLLDFLFCRIFIPADDPVWISWVLISRTFVSADDAVALLFLPEEKSFEEIKTCRVGN